MAREQQVDLKTQVLEALYEHPSGLTRKQIAEAIKFTGSESRLYEAIRELVSARKIFEVREEGSGRGAPPIRYVSAAAKSALATAAGAREIKVSPRDLLESAEQEPDERSRREASEDVLHRIARGHLESERHAHAIIQAAPEMGEMNPIRLILDMLEWVVDDLNEIGRRVVQLTSEEQSLRAADALAAELQSSLDAVHRLFCRYYRLTEDVLSLPSAPSDFLSGEQARFNRDLAERQLSSRVFGERFMEVFTPEPVGDYAVGTDASVADIVLEHEQGSFIPPDPVAVTVSAAALRTRPGHEGLSYHEFDILPDDLRHYTDAQAAVRGLVISPLFRQMLPEEDFRHTRMAAMDMRQYAHDLRVAVRESRWRPLGEAPALDMVPRPGLVIRDGRLFPLVHRIKDFESGGLYGKIVREEINRFAQAFAQLVIVPGARTVYAAVVKNPELSWMSPLVFWYLHTRPSKDWKPGREAIYRPPLSDTAVVHLLFLGLAKSLSTLPDGMAFRTFRLARRYPDLLLGDDVGPPWSDKKARYINEDDEEEWRDWFAEHVENLQEQRRRRRIHITPLPLEEYDVLVGLCTCAGVAMGYGVPVRMYAPLVENADGAHFLLPRLETAFDFRNPKANLTGLDAVISWMTQGGCDLDEGHTQLDFQNAENGRGMPVLIPDVLVAAHEAAGFARSLLSEEFIDEVRKLVSALRARLGSHPQKT